MTRTDAARTVGSTHNRSHGTQHARIGAGGLRTWGLRLLLVVAVVGGIALASGSAAACNIKPTDGDCGDVGITEDESEGVAEHSKGIQKGAVQSAKGAKGGLVSARGAIGGGAGGGIDASPYKDST